MLRLLTAMVMVHVMPDLIHWNSLVAMESKVWHVPWRDIRGLRHKLGMRADLNRLGSVDISQRHAMVIERDKRKPPWLFAAAA